MTIIEMGRAVELDLETPFPESGDWLSDIKMAVSAPALRSKLSSRFPALKDGNPRQIIILGAAGEGVRLANLAKEHGIEVLGIADDNHQRLSTDVAGLKVCSTSDLSGFDVEVPVIIASHRPLQSIQRLRKMGFQTVTLFTTLQIIAPDRFPPHMFYDGWLEDMVDNVEEYERLMDSMDDQSRIHLNAILGFRQTIDIGVIAPIIDWNVYELSGLLSFAGNEVYVDAGTFDGDSIKLFVDRMDDKFERIIGFEPDPVTFDRLRANFLADDRVEAVNKGLFDRTGSMRFVNDASRGAILIDDGGLVVDVTSLDDFLHGDRVSFIKMNIEGAELAALSGARESIKKWSPKLAISAYHRPSDLWQVPQRICELNPDYKLALRQHDAGSIEIVAYGY